jgi:hypothetical protein
MAVEAIAASVGGMGGAGSVPGGIPQDATIGQPASPGSHGAGFPPASEPTPPASQATLESRAGRIGGPAEGPLNRTPEVPASPHQSGISIGKSVLDRVNTMQKGDAAWRTGEAGKPAGTQEPTLKVASRDPGPAAAQLKPDALQNLDVAGRPTMQPSKTDTSSFDRSLQQLQQVSDQIVQVSIASKTTSSFTGALNKLLSST